jgi:EAL domain-containing protein (putative c-di-GMP-specific phosphodiesterase class I)/DNA-binding LacI/PurR family transcriptional regulator
MADKPKLIGVCLSQAHNFPNTGFLNALNSAAAAGGYAVAVFNSSMDFSWQQKDNIAARAIYKTIRYELFSALLIIYHSMHDDELVSGLVQGAQEHGVPVICAGAELPGCWSIVNDYEQSFKALLRHVIADHGAKDTFFIAGLKNEPNSEFRFRCYREVLEEFSLPFRESQMAYGNYWSSPAREIVRKLIRNRKKLPQAIFCANDTMAVAVCDTLRENGFRVPGDVIVTGFDGSPVAWMVKPNLTTCGEDPETLAVQTVDLIDRLRAGEEPPRRIIHSFRPILSESCGCPPVPNDRFDVISVYRRAEMLNTHENDLYYKVELMVNQRDSESFLKMISQSILPDSVIYLNHRFMDIYAGIDFFADIIEEDLLSIPFREPDQPLVAVPCALSSVRPSAGQPTGTTVFNVIRAGNMVCGFYAARTEDPTRDIQLIKRVSDVLNLVFAIQLGNARQQMLITHLDNSLYLDSVTGLSNLKGLTRWFDNYSANPDSHQLPLALSVYCINRYSYIYETYGMNDTEEITRLVGGKLASVNSEALVVARISEDQFVVVYNAENEAELSRTIDRFTRTFFTHIETWNAASSKPYFVEVNCGCTVMEKGWDHVTLGNLIRLALGELYLNRMRTSNREVIKPSVSSPAMYSAFSLLMEKNLLRFHFQPIVDAKTAQIFAYEALMRTDNLVQLSPLEILDIAREYNRLYDVEKATLFGIIDRYVRHFSDFNGCKVFINTIPGHFLTQEDVALLKARYESYLDCFVFELTEQNITTDEELTRLKSLCKDGSHTLIAIDDYGTGHSNMVNVLRYAPQLIKIDRELISGIQNDSNKQLFVRNTIDFAHQNEIRALAEGVETAEELRTVIDLGVDLIQGFFTGRPAEKPLAAVSEPIRDMILEENLSLARYDRSTRIYSASDGETVDLLKLALEAYTEIQAPAGHLTLVGHDKQGVDMIVRVPDDTKAEITLRSVNMKGVNESILQLGNHCDLTLRVEKNNILNKDGIHVPSTSRLTIVGDGNLKVVNNRNFSIGIGANCNDPYGTIVIDLEGTVTVDSSGDKVACLGGGRSAGEGIHILRGACMLKASGITALGAGSIAGDASIDIRRDASVSVALEGNDTVGLGTFSGNAAIQSAGRIEVFLQCERATGIGTMNGFGETVLKSGSVLVTVHCSVGACIGTFSGEYSSRFCGAVVRIHGEGNRVAGFGSPDGACNTNIESGDVQGELLAGERMLLGNEHSRVVITGGNARLFPEGTQVPVSPGGLPLICQTPKEDHFEQTFSDRRGTWTYLADRNAEGNLFVWIPK